MQKIVPNLWFDKTADAAAEFYTSICPESKITGELKYPSSAKEDLADFQLDMAGKTLTKEFVLGDLKFIAINAGAEFKPNPSISFMVNFDPSRDDKARENLQILWSKLIEGGKALMPLDKYDFIKLYGWVEDKYGFSWQLILTDPEGEPRPFIIPSLMFVGDALGKARQAREYYLTVFPDSRAGIEALYPATTEMFKKDDIMFSDASLSGQWFAMNDGGPTQDFTFNEAVSLLVNCRDQAEIDYYWDKLSAKPEHEQCGWCEDKFGVHWQVAPANMDSELMKNPNAYKVMMQQKKIIIEELENA